MLVAPIRTAALDTSNLGNISRDLGAADAGIRKKAARFLLDMQDMGFVPLLTFHHIEELLAHENLEKARTRLRFLQSLKVVAWVKSIDPVARLGSIVDILCVEVDQTFKDPSASIVDIRDRVRARLFAFGTGEEALAAITPHWEVLRLELLSHVEMTRHTVAISRSNHLDVSQEKVSSFLRGKRRDPVDVVKTVKGLTKALAKQITERGDPRIVGSEQIAAGFMEEIIDEGLPLVLDGEEGAWQLLERWLITPADCGPETTMGELMELSQFRKRLKLASRNLRLPWEAVLSTVDPLRLPSVVTQRSIARNRQDQPRHEGGELNDTYLAVLAMYADFCTVDKRMQENLRRCVSKDEVVKDLIRHYVRCGRYEDLPAKMAAVRC